ncbi:E3 ubiquitin ligase TRAF3IP2-like isoform X1 [Conger conger]|uniref:E3 ubiquitin ligase TRAF3IP2-like isoform X1 n=1 Tax=Conger conger TaxID=82655 RepID=UPI002A5AA0F4|nr:E3 ubiquitin ligase TRAF3IP2-like isoform X1 [Conger conger]
MMKYATLQTESLNCPEENDESLSEGSLSSTHSSPRPDRRNPCIPPPTASCLRKMADGRPYSSDSAQSSYDPYHLTRDLPSGCDAPFPSRADGCPSCPHLHKGAWPPPSYGSSFYSGGGYSTSLPFCPPPSEYTSCPPGQDRYPYSKSYSCSQSYGSLEQPQSLRSMAPTAGAHEYYLGPYHPCPHTPQGPARCDQSPAEGFGMGHSPHHSPRPGHHRPYGHPGPDHCGCQGTGSTHSVNPHAHLRQNTALCTPLSLEQRKVFVTYEADCEKHVNEIIKFVALLRHNGFDTHIDVFEQQFISISKIDFMEKFINEKDYLIIIAISPKYHKTVTGTLVSMENDERTLNTVYIHKQLQNEFIQNGCRNFRFIPILFPGAKKCHVPTWLQNTHVYSWPKNRDDILRRLMRVEKYNPPPIGELPTIVSIPL